MRVLSVVGTIIFLVVAIAHAATVTPFYALPPQPAGTGNLAFWIDHKTSKNFVFQDALVSPTVAMLEDMTGNGNGFNQGNKTLQPSVGTLGGPYFGASSFLPCVGGDMLSGAQQVTLGFAFTLSSRYAGTRSRVLFDVSSPHGLPLQHQLQIYATGGTGATARVIQVALQPNGGNQLITSTAGAWQLSADVKHTLVVEINLAASPATVNVYVDGLVYGSTSTFATIQTAFAQKAAYAIYLGNAVTSPDFDMPLNGEIAGGLGYLGIGTIERAAAISYLGGL
jgi:hypothetical protein